MRNVVIPNLPFLPSPPLPSLSLIGCHERLDVCLVCACVRTCIWQLSTSDQRGLRLCWMSGRIIKRRRLAHSAWRRRLHSWHTHKHTHTKALSLFFSLTCFFHVHFVSINLSNCQPSLRHGFVTLMPLTLCPRLNTRKRGWLGSQAKMSGRMWKMPPKWLWQKEMPVCVCALAKLCLCPLQV